MTGILVLAFVFRLVLGHFFALYGADAPQYTAIGKNLAAGHGYSLATHAPYVPTDIRLPAYPAFLALAFSFSDSHGSIIVLNALLGTVSTVFVWLMARALRLTPGLALLTAGIAAVVPATASLAGTAYSENLSVPAVLAFVYVVLVRPPRSRLALFVVGSLLAWLVALTRDELIVFVVLVGIVAAHRTRLRVVGSVALVLCFLLGSIGWVVRNDLQVHRIEYADSVIEEQGLVYSVNQSFDTPIYKQGQALIDQPAISPAQRSQYRHHTFEYVKWFLGNHFATFAKDKVKYYVEAIFPPPIFAFTFTPTLKALPWSLLLLVEYGFALVTMRRWWIGKRRKEVVALGIYPLFIACLMIFVASHSRFWLPSVLLLLPVAVNGVATTIFRRAPAPGG